MANDEQPNSHTEEPDQELKNSTTITHTLLLQRPLGRFANVVEKSAS